MGAIREQWLIFISTPVYIIIIGLELLLTHLQHRKTYTLKDTAANLYLMLLNSAIDLSFRIIYLAILSGLMVIISNTFVDLSKGRGRAEARNEVNAAIRFATEKIRQDAKGASAVVTPTLGTPGSTLQMTVGGTPVTYDVLLGQLRRNDNGTIATTTGTNVFVGTPTFTRLENYNTTLLATTTSVQVAMTFSYNSSSTDWAYSTAMRTTMTLR